MGTKADPGEFDCYADLADDEPMFVLRARDPLAEPLAALWAAVVDDDMPAVRTALWVLGRNGAEKRAGIKARGKDAVSRYRRKAAEAKAVAQAMREWRAAHPDKRLTAEAKNG